MHGQSGEIEYRLGYEAILLTQRDGSGLGHGVGGVQVGPSSGRLGSEVSKRQGMARKAT